jgi:hypothetical protein
MRTLHPEQAPRVPEQPRLRVPVPVDPALPRLPVLLDPDAMAPFLHRSLGSDAPLPDGRVHRVHYAPGRKLVVRYDVGLDGCRYDAVAMIAVRPYLAQRAVKPESLALAGLVEGRSPARMPLHYVPELEALIQWYPLDLDLPALAEPPARLVDELEATGLNLGELDAAAAATLAYRPGRRAVLRLGDHVLKIYAKNEDFAAAAANLLAAAGLRGIRTPGFEGHLPGRQVTVQPLLLGSPPARPAEVALAAGELLRELADLDAAPEADLVVARPSRQLAVAEASARIVGALLPALGGRLEARASSW